MPAKELPARPNIEQYKKQAKELLSACTSGDPDAIERVRSQTGSGSVPGADAGKGRAGRSMTLADAAGVRAFLARDAGEAVRKGGPLGWDALTYLCFSRYLRLDKSRSHAFVNTARALLDAGASANTGWYETIDKETQPRQVIEAAIYGAAGIAQHAGVTRLLLERGADPNDGETPYHVPETTDNTVL